MTNKILFITQSLPPRPGPAGRRLRLLAEQAKEDNFEVYAIRLDRNYEGKEVSGIKVSALAGHDLRTWMGGQNPGGTVERTTEPGWMKLLRDMRQSYPFLLLTDDGGYFYRRDAYHIGRRLVKKEGIGTIYSSFRPWSDHLIARKLKKKYPDILWIADFRDLPVDLAHQNIWWPALQRWWGKRMIKLADEIWTVSEGQQRQMKGWHPNIKVRRSILAELPPTFTAPKSKQFTILYTGSLYQNLRTPEKLVHALRRLLDSGKINREHIHLIYRGKDSEYFREFTKSLPGDMLDIKPQVSTAEALDLQARAQVLLLLTWSAPGYYGVLTAKLWEYLSTGRPILALVNGPGDQELKNIIEGAEAGVVFGDEEQGKLDEWILNGYQKWERNGTLEWKVNTTVLKKHRGHCVFKENKSFQP